MEEKINEVLSRVRPHLQMDGGDVEFVSFDESSGVLKLRLKGACHGCPMAHVTLNDGIGKLVMEEIPEVKKVEAV